MNLHLKQNSSLTTKFLLTPAPEAKSSYDGKAKEFCPLAIFRTNNDLFAWHEPGRWPGLTEKNKNRELKDPGRGR